jgi:putative MATE family efflux protein
VTATLKKLFNPIDMTDGKPWKSLLLFTVPMLLGNVVQQLYSTVDAVVVGQYIGDNALAAVGSTVPLFFLLLVLFIGISSGAGIMVSQYIGAKRREDLSYTIGNCITVLTLASILIMAFAPLGTRPLLNLLNTPESILDDAVIYLNVLLWGVLGLGYYNILTGILRGMGDSFYPLVYLVVACVLNIALDLLFVAVLGWGIASVAAATVLCQAVSGVLCIRRLMRMQDIFDFKRIYLRPNKLYVNQMIRLGLPTGASQAIFSLAMVLVQSLVNGFGELFIAANVITMRIDGFVMMPIFSFGNAITVFTGQNVGAGKLERVKQGTWQCGWMAVVTSVVLMAIILTLGEPIARMFTDTDMIVHMSVTILWILTAGYVSMAFSQVLWGVIRGAGDTITPMWASIITVVFLRVPSAYLLVYFMDSWEALPISMLLSWLIGTVIALVAYRMGKWRTKGIVRREAEVDVS